MALYMREQQEHPELCLAEGLRVGSELRQINVGDIVVGV